jgi:hypothetical protein
MQEMAAAAEGNWSRARTLASVLRARVFLKSELDGCAVGSLDDAETLLVRVKFAATEGEDRRRLAQAHEALAELFERRGKREASVEHFTIACELFNEVGMHKDRIECAARIDGLLAETSVGSLVALAGDR